MKGITLFTRVNTIKKLLISTSLLILSTTIAYANPLFDSGDLAPRNEGLYQPIPWYNRGIKHAKVLSITTRINGDFYVYFDKDICDKGSFSKTGYVQEAHDTQWTKEGASMLLKIALAAKLSGKKVEVFADDFNEGWGCRVGALTLE